MSLTSLSSLLAARSCRLWLRLLVGLWREAKGGAAAATATDAALPGSWRGEATSSNATHSCCTGWSVGWPHLPSCKRDVAGIQCNTSTVEKRPAAFPIVSKRGGRGGGGGGEDRRMVIVVDIGGTLISIYKQHWARLLNRQQREHLYTLERLLRLHRYPRSDGWSSKRDLVQPVSTRSAPLQIPKEERIKAMQRMEERGRQRSKKAEGTGENRKKASSTSSLLLLSVSLSQFRSAFGGHGLGLGGQSIRARACACSGGSAGKHRHQAQSRRCSACSPSFRLRKSRPCLR